MRTWLRLACLVGLVFAGLATAAAPPARPLAGLEIQRLIEQMGDRNYALRDRAARRLQAEGIAALPYLRKAIGHKDLEIRRRALLLVPGLEHAAVVAPRRISMTVSNQPLSAVLAELSKQSGYKVYFNDNNGFMPGMPGGAIPAKGKIEKRYNFTCLNTPFWDVIDRLCRDNNLIVSQSWGDDSVRLYPAAGYSAHAGCDGAFRYSAVNMAMNRQIDLSTSNTALTPEGRVDNLTFNFQIFAEPRLPFLGMGEIRIDAAYDSERNSMLVPANASELENHGRFRGGRMWNRGYYNGGYKQMNMQSSMSLQRVSQKAATLKVLRGVVPVTLLVEQKPMPIADKILSAKGKKSRIGDLEFHIDTVDFKKASNQISIKFSTANKGNPNDYNWMNNLMQRIELVDAKGQKFQNYGSNWVGNNGNNVTLTVTFNPGGQKLGPPERFVFLHWVTRQHDIHFEFKDIPLP